MQRYFVSEKNWNNDRVEIYGDDRHHIANVMRMNIGDQIIACHPDGQSVLCKIEMIDQDVVSCTIQEKLEENNELPIHIIIAQGLLKGDKLDMVVQKGTELGMQQFIPLQLERSIVKWDNKKAKKKIDRLYKIAKEASEQSERTKLPTIHSALSLEQLINQNDYDHLLVASEYIARSGQQSSAFSKIMRDINENERVLIVFGPEGGFSEPEMQYLAEKGSTFIRLGKRILRAETAPLYVLSSFSFYFEEWRC